jgi:circadian clock protein KaiC
LLEVVAVPLLLQETTEVGAFTLDGLLASIERSASRIGARRLVIDGLDGFFAYFESHRTLRAEFLRLAHRCAELELTTVLTGSVSGELHRLEEYLADCVLRLDHRVDGQVSTRRLRVAKYRGSAHGTDEYPFVITSTGLCVYPITSAGLTHLASSETLSTGVPDLDEMLAGRGLFRGSAVLVAGPAGTGKTTLAAHVAGTAACSGVRCLYFSFEESPDQLRRNMASVGLDLNEAEQTGQLVLRAARPSMQGLEQHLAELQMTALESGAEIVVIDPMTNLVSVGSRPEVKAMLTRLLDDFKKREVTVILTSLILSGDPTLGADIGISSLMDTILSLEHEVAGYQRRQLLSILKSRGIGHSKEVRELVFSDSGIAVQRVVEDGAGSGR